MKYLQKNWIRILVSLLAGGFASEIIHISTGDPDRPTTSGENYIVLIFAAFTFFILTIVINKQKN